MEHRWSTRAAIPVTVTVYNRGTRLLTTTTRNLSRQGVLLLAESDALGNARSVELRFALDRDTKSPQLRLPAYVIHRDGGIGLMFTDYSKKVQRELDRLLRGRTLGYGVTAEREALSAPARRS